MILEKIIQNKRQVVEVEKLHMPLRHLLSYLEVDVLTEVNKFHQAIKNGEGVSIIGEVKKASPSKGILRKDFHPINIAKIYEENNVDAISVLTDFHFFKGSNLYLKEIKKTTSLPLLRKDFIIDSYQIYQSKLLGADAILLIVAALDFKELIYFQKIAWHIGLQCIVEVHDEEELLMALEADAKLIGINNRNLNTFNTTLTTTERLATKIPKDKIIISESGIGSKKDMIFLEQVGVDAVLIGESFMVAPSIEEKIKELRGE